MVKEYHKGIDGKMYCTSPPDSPTSTAKIGMTTEEKLKALEAENAMLRSFLDQIANVSEPDERDEAYLIKNIALTAMEALSTAPIQTPDEKWMKCAGAYDLEALKNREYYGGLDLANAKDALNSLT